jgi:hypothetical protein
MSVKASAEKREFILKSYKYFGAESKRKAPFYAWKNCLIFGRKQVLNKNII